MRKSVLYICSIIALLLIVLPAYANGRSSVCSHGGEWSEHQAPPLSEVAGAVEYCVKGGDVDSGGYLEYGSFEYVSSVVEGNIHDLSHWSYRMGEPTPTPTRGRPTPPPTNTPMAPTDEPTPTNTDEPEVTPEPTFVPTATEKPCKAKRLGMLFTLIGPDGQVGYLASYQRNPNTGDWAIPNVASQLQCLGWVAVSAPNGDVIEIGCDRQINIVCRRCMGGGPDEAYGDN